MKLATGRKRVLFLYFVRFAITPLPIPIAVYIYMHYVYDAVPCTKA